MNYDTKFYTYLKNHNRIIDFDYNVVIDWAVHLLMNGHDHKSLAMIAGFSKPVGRDAIGTYVSQALEDLLLLEMQPSEDLDDVARYYISKIVEKENIRKNLEHLHKISLKSDTMNYNVFYSLYHAWRDLETSFVQNELKGIQYYFDGAHLHNIESLVLMESEKWLKNNPL